MVSFDGSASTAVNGTIVDWSWDFGDGTTGSGAAVTHTYGTQGIYFAELNVTDNQGRVNLTPLLNRVTVATPLQVTAGLSRKTHGGAGTFDINLPLTGAPGVECRNGSGNHTLVFSFTNTVTSGSASVTSGTGTISGTPVFADNTMTVTLTGVANAQTLTLTLSNVIDSFAQVLPDTTVSLGILIGDTTGDGSVNSADISQTKSQSGNLVTGSNFREDLTIDGNVNSADISLVKSKSGTALP